MKSVTWPLRIQCSPTLSRVEEEGSTHEPSDWEYEPCDTPESFQNSSFVSGSTDNSEFVGLDTEEFSSLILPSDPYEFLEEFKLPNYKYKLPELSEFSTDKKKKSKKVRISKIWYVVFHTPSFPMVFL